MDLYPVHLQLKGRTALVVGGGAVAAWKARSLVQGGANVRGVAPDPSPEMEQAVAELGLPFERRAFDTADLEGAWLVVGATDDPSLHQRILEEARGRGILVHIVDDPERSDFIVPAVLRRGDLIVTVSTSGVAPAFAARLRDHLGEILGEHYGRILEDLKIVREGFKSRYPDLRRRRDAWRLLLDRHVLPALRRGEVPEIAKELHRVEERA